MFGMGMQEILLILAIGLIILGPKKIPEIAKSLGRGIAEFKKATQDFKRGIEVDNSKEGKQTLQPTNRNIEKTAGEAVSQGSASFNGDNDLKQVPVNTTNEAPKECAENALFKEARQSEQKEPPNVF